MTTTTQQQQHQLKEKEEEEGDVIIKIKPSIISTSADSSTLNYSSSNKIKYCSFILKVVGILIIVGIVLLFALLPNYLRNKNTQDTYTIENNTDPTNARLPTA